MGVPRFEPFTALRFSPSLPLDAVAAPPYDVLSDADVDALLARHPRNIVAIDVPRDADGPQRYELAAQRLAQWVSEGTLERDAQPSFTLYRMRFTDETGRERETVGVVGALEVVDEGAPGVLPHERTTPKAKTDRLDLARATNTNLSPVWGLSLTEGLTDLLREPGEPMGTCRDEAGVLHIVERVSHPQRVAAIAAAVGSHPVLIADGHHRYAISRTFRDEVRAEHGDDTAAELTLTYVAELVGDQLSIDAIHRLYHGVSVEQLLAVLTPAFHCAEAGAVTPAFAAEVVERGCLCLVRPDGTGVWLTGAHRVRGGACTRRRLPRTRAGDQRHRGQLPAWRATRRRPRDQRRRCGRCADSPDRHRRDPAHCRRAIADASEVDVLHTQAAHRAGTSAAELTRSTLSA